MSNKKLVSLAVATLIGAALIAAPAQARVDGGRHSGIVRGPVLVGRAAVGHHPFFRHHRFEGPFLGLGLAPYGWGWPDYGYDDVPTDASGDIDNVVPEPPPTSVCNRSVETVTVPSEDGGTRQIKMIRCP